MLVPGKYYSLRLIKFVSFGAYLDGGEDQEILLPSRYVPADAEVDQKYKVFIYRDSEDRIIATTDFPVIALDEIAFLEITQVNNAGAFAEWGPIKELLIPYQEQNVKLLEGGIYPIKLLLDESTQRLYGTAKINSYVQDFVDEHDAIKVKDAVSLLIWERTDLGYNCIINHQYRGLLYHNDIFSEVGLGQIIPGFVKEIRPDGRIDVTIRKPLAQALDSDAQIIMGYLSANGGVSALYDGSSAEDIQATFGLSKKAFKRAVGTLYKQRLIQLLPTSIVMVVAD